MTTSNDKAAGGDLCETLATQQNCDDVVDDQIHVIQMRYKLSSPTLESLRKIKQSPNRGDILKLACFATEFQSHPISSQDRAFLRQVNDHKPIPYRVTESISFPWHKAFLLVQLHLSGSPWPNLSATARKNLYQESGAIYSILKRVLRSLVDILGLRQDGRGVQVALDVLRSVSAGAWEGTPRELLQVENIGPKSFEKLQEAGINSVRSLANLEFCRIERLLSRNPPFGHQMLEQLSGFPILGMTVDLLDGLTDDSKTTPWGTPFPVAVVNLTCKNKKVPEWHKVRPFATLVVEEAKGRLVWFWRGSVKNLVGGKVMCLALAVRKGEVLTFSLSCEEIVGTMVREIRKVL